MGNSASSSGRSHQDESVDYGYLTPQGVYTAPRDWNHTIVSQLICQRKLAPFYRPLEDYNNSWDDDQILTARRPLLDADGESVTRTETTPPTVSSNKSTHNKRPGALKEPSKPEAAVYRGAVECPICFLYYPPNINYSRCCDQAICTECFVQIKRNEPTTTHLVSEPAACPYCVQENFGVVYTPPLWRSGIGSEGPSPDPTKGMSQTQQFLENSSQYATHKRRQKSFSADSPEVVTTDQIRPDWEAKLATVRAAVARRANRRIVMRQVGDRLIPVGVTSGRVHPLGQEDTSTDGNENAGSRRRRRPHGQGFEQFLGMSGQDLEELMIMEAMRLSLVEHEEQQRKEAAERKKIEGAAASAELLSETISTSEPSAGPGPSTVEARSRSGLQSPESTSPSSTTSVLVASSRPFTESDPTDSAPVNSESQSSAQGQANDANASMSTDGTAWHLRKSSSPPSNTPSRASAISTNEAIDLTNGSTNGDQPPSYNSFTAPSSHSAAHIDEPRTINSFLADPSRPSISLSVPIESSACDRPPSPPSSPSAGESLLGSNVDTQVFQKVRHPTENRQDFPS
ncbi:hypothetical protein AX15_004973 [Amanita polypyramis BW_CC]|nr:hypothetical protein AX15_004973 [Amanita polypyramis BW_CC]